MKKKKILENWFYRRDSAAADNIRVDDLRLLWEDDGAYPFAWFSDDDDEELYIGDESSMHSSPTQKFIEERVKKQISKYGIDAEFEGYFTDEWGDELDWLDQNNEDNLCNLVDYVYYTIYDDKQYGKCCHIELTFKDGKTYKFDTEYDNVYDELERNYCENEDIAWEIWQVIDNDRGIERNNMFWYNVDEEADNEDFDVEPFLEGEYHPTEEELNNGLQCITDSGRFWVYDKVICFWSIIPRDYLQTCLSELEEKTEIDFSDYNIVYEDEDTEEVKCVSVQEYMNSGNETYVADERENKGIHLKRAEEKWKETEGWRDIRDNKILNKLSYRDHEGNIRTDKEPMTMAQYHNMIYGESKDDIKKKFNIILEKISKNYNPNRQI